MYFNPDSVDELADCMLKLECNNELAKQMIGKGFLQAEKFSWEKYSKEFVNLLEVKFGKLE